MSVTMNPYLTFPGTTAEAMTFYQRVFGGSLAVNTFAEFGEQAAELADKVMHARLDTDRGFTLMASDPAPGMELTTGNTVSVSLSGDDADELRRYWDQLSADGTVHMPLDKQVWGDTFGMCVDRFGLTWLVNISEPAS